MNSSRWVVLLLLIGAACADYYVNGVHYDTAKCTNAPFDPPAPGPGWPRWGRDHSNTHYQPAERNISTASVVGMHEVCRFVFPGEGFISAPPTTTGDMYLYAADDNGYIYALNRFTCAVLWTYNVSAFLATQPIAPIAWSVSRNDSRTSPAIDRGFLYIGTQVGAYLIKLNRFTGQQLWAVQVDPHPLALLTMSPVIDGEGRVYVGTSSQEEIAAYFDIPPSPYNFTCCTHIGAMFAFNSFTGQRLWRTPMLPDNHGVPTNSWSGGGVWGAGVPINFERRLIYIATGNAYQTPDSVELCRNLTYAAQVSAYNTAYNFSSVIQRDPCRIPIVNGTCGDCSESILALNMDTGRIMWASQKGALDSWNVACGIFRAGLSLPPKAGYCPQVPGPDSDFGMAPTLMPASCGGPDIGSFVFTGQKSGIAWGNSADTGEDIWATSVGPSGIVGGLQWGMATDGKRIYFIDSNGSIKNRTLLMPNGTEITISYMTFGALDFNGNILWQWPSPHGGYGQATLSTANGVVFVGGRDSQGWVYALNGLTGEVLWSNNSGLGGHTGSMLPGDGYLITVGGIKNRSGGLVIYSV